MYEIDRAAFPVEVLSTHEEIGANGVSSQEDIVFDGSEPSLSLKDEIARRISSNYLMTILNIEIIDYWVKPTRSQPEDAIPLEAKETYFPRLAFLNLDESLI